MEVITDENKINDLLTRGVEEVIVYEELKEKLKSGKKLRIKLGIDPTSPNIHIGRSIPLLKLRDFQELGHQIVFIVGDFTGVVGDTSDKESERPMLSVDIVKENMKGYVEQAGKIIDLSKCEIHYNSEWLGKLTYSEIGEQADCFALSDFISRENIKKRLDNGTRVSLREVLYPLMQGYDSVAIRADVELGGTDQKFNLLAGRRLQERNKQEPQNIIMNPLISGTDGRKMSSSWGNVINLKTEPNDMYGKVMSLSDDLIIQYFELTTRVPLEVVFQYKKQLEDGINPRDVKMRLALEITRMYHGEVKAGEAQNSWEKTFQKKEIPEEMMQVAAGNKLIEILVSSKIVPSKSEARRLIQEGAITELVKNEKIKDENYAPVKGEKFRIGKKNFMEVI